MNCNLRRSHGRIFVCCTYQFVFYFSLCLWVVTLCAAISKLIAKKILKPILLFKNLGFFRFFQP